MSGRLSVFVVGVVAALTISYLVDNHTVSGQSPTRFAAVPGEKGGQDIFGAYEAVADWPKDLSTIKGHEGWTFGAGQSVFAESPNRIFVLQRGELPALGRPKTIDLPQLGPNLQFPDRAAAVARRDDCEPARQRRHRSARRGRHAGVGEGRRRQKVRRRRAVGAHASWSSTARAT